jgi:HSP20 family protein
VFSRQLVLGEDLDLDRIQAGYPGRVLRLVIPVAEGAKPRKISISHRPGDQAVTTGNGNGRTVDTIDAADDTEKTNA